MSDSPDPIIVLSDGNGIHAGTVEGVRVSVARYDKPLKMQFPAQLMVDRRGGTVVIEHTIDAAAIAERDDIIARWRAWERYAAVRPGDVMDAPVDMGGACRPAIIPISQTGYSSLTQETAESMIKAMFNECTARLTARLTKPPVSLTTGADPTAALAFINTTRAKNAQRDLDPVSAGWTDDDVVREATDLGWAP